MNPALSGFFFVKIGHLSFLKNREVNILRTATQLSQDDPNVFNVFWMAGLERKGTVQVMTPPYLSGRYIAAELSAIKWLLEQANVCGHDKTGAGLHLYLSSQDTLDLVQKTSQSSHLVPYVNFLHTRFYGCEVSLDEDRTWATAGCEKEVSAINATPIRTSISVQGVGEVELTAHAVEMYVMRFGRKPTRAWRELIKQAETAKEILFVDRHPVFDVQHRNPGKHYATQGGQIFVITPPNADSPMPRLVTVTKPSSLPARFIS